MADLLAAPVVVIAVLAFVGLCGEGIYRFKHRNDPKIPREEWDF